MFKSNEFNYTVNPLKNTLTLTLTKKSKRNILIKNVLLPLALMATVPVVSAFIDGVIDGVENSDTDENETPDPED